MKRVNKGEFGYIRYHKIFQIVKTILYFVVPLIMVYVGLHNAHNTESKLSLLAVIGMVLCLPGCKELVNVVIFIPKKSMDKALHDRIEEKVGDLVHLYELNLTTYEKNYPIESMVISGSSIAALTLKRDADLRACEDHIKRILKDNGMKQNVKIFIDEKHYFERISQLIEKSDSEEIPFTPDERYPELSREELIKHIILAISL